MSKKAWWHEGVRFECQGSGKCCVSRGEYGFVYLTRQDRIRMANSMGLPTRTFTRLYCDKTDGVFHLKDGKATGECLFLADKKCTVYEGRPTQCRTWPFWPEVMNPKTWQKEVKTFCPGIGKGPRWSKERIQRVIDEQKRSEENLGS